MTKLVNCIEPHSTFHDSTTLGMQLSVHVSRLRYRVFPSSRRFREEKSKDQCLVVKAQSVLEMDELGNCEEVDERGSDPTG